VHFFTQVALQTLIQQYHIAGHTNNNILKYNLYYFLTHFLMLKLFKLETCIDLLYFMLNFYQINRDGEIRTRDHLVIKALIPCQIIISTQ
jgi:hypothetical protein